MNTRRINNGSHTEHVLYPTVHVVAHSSDERAPACCRERPPTVEDSTPHKSTVMRHGVVVGHRLRSHIDMMHIHAPLIARSTLFVLLLAAAVEPAGAVDCTADVAFNNVFAITSAVSKRNDHLRAECAREGLKCTLVPDMPKDALDVSKLQALARTSSEL